jgi:hypothetical protein
VQGCHSYLDSATPKSVKAGAKPRKGKKQKPKS